jgi:hypothetical protein
MNKASIELLNKRIEGLDKKDFDLEAWKSGSALLLTRIFGDGNSYAKGINDLKVDYSSWSLRDATADYNPRESCKRIGREIIELAIAELQLPPDQHKAAPDVTDILVDKSGELTEAIANKDEKAMLNLLNKEKKDKLAKLLVKFLAK